MRATEIATKASDLVGGDRHQDHGELLTNFHSIASIWNGYLLARMVNAKSRSLSAEDVANMMELMKVARRLSGRTNMDDYVDGAGYAAIAGEIRARTKAVTI